jgi:hypothetical protein
MSVEVPCPQCGAVLKAPPGMGGKKARCKKCQHSFRLPGDAAPDASAEEESQQLSVVDQPAFSFEGPADGAMATPASPSRGKYKSASASTRSSMAGARAKPKSSGGRVVVFTLVALALAGVAAAVVLLNQEKPQPAASAGKPPEKDKDDKLPAKSTDKETTAKANEDGKAANKATPTKTGPEPAKAGSAPKAAAARKNTTVVTGGLKFPPPPAKPQSTAKPTAKLAIDAALSTVKAFTITGGDQPMAVLVRSTDVGFQGQGGKDTVDRYSLDTGNRLDSTEVDAVPAAAVRVIDISPNGEACVSEGPAGTLTVYDLSRKAKSETVKPFKPFARDEKTQVPLAAVYFVDDQSVLVIATSGLLERWNIRDGKKLGEGSLGAAGEFVQGRSFGLKPDRSALAVIVGDTVQIVDVASLSAKPALTLPKGSEKAYAVGFADTGDRLAVAYRAASPGPHTVIAVGRIGDPKVRSYHIDDAAGPALFMAWCGPECFVTAFEKSAVVMAFETEINKPLATLWPQGGVGWHATYHGKHYALMPDTADMARGILIGVDFPPSDFLPLRNEAEEAKAPIPFLLTPDGLGR